MPQTSSSALAEILMRFILASAFLAFPPSHRYIARLNRARSRDARVFWRGWPDTDAEMPKLKSKSGAKKRFGRTATGKVKRNWGHKRHLLINKSKQGKRLRRGTTTLEKGDAKLVLTYLPYLRG
jgi:large subunit ribosomal protein L35